MSRKSSRRKPKPKKQSERAWCAVYRALMPYRTGLADGTSPMLLVFRQHIASKLKENADAIDAIPVDELFAIYAAGGRAALYSRCIVGEPGGIMHALSLLDRQELAAIDLDERLKEAFTGLRDEMRRSSQAIDAFIAAFRLHV